MATWGILSATPAGYKIDQTSQITQADGLTVFWSAVHTVHASWSHICDNKDQYPTWPIFYLPLLFSSIKCRPEMCITLLLNCLYYTKHCHSHIWLCNPNKWLLQLDLNTEKRQKCDRMCLILWMEITNTSCEFSISQNLEIIVAFKSVWRFTLCTVKETVHAQIKIMSLFFSSVELRKVNLATFKSKWGPGC